MLRPKRVPKPEFHRPYHEGGKGGDRRTSGGTGKSPEARIATDLERWEQQVQTVVDALRDIPGVGVERVFDRPEDSELHPVPIPRAWIELHCADVQKRLLHELEMGDPAISVRQVGKTVVAIALQTSCGKVRIRWSRSAADSAAARCTKSGGIAPVIPERWRMCCTRVHR